MSITGTVIAIYVAKSICGAIMGASIAYIGSDLYERRKAKRNAR